MDDRKLDFWIKNNLNVLFIGKHGIGKSSVIIDAFNRNKLKWKYFSASTMDPWVDFIGVPKEFVEKDGTPYLDLVRPREFQDDSVEAIFFDEFNRSHKKIRNAVMELIQFKSINGKKFKNLKIIWAAINPDEDNVYDVEKLDPAQIDRFHVHYNMPYKCDKPYFIEKFGVEIADNAIEWWNDLTDELKDKIPPRRLDYALDVYIENGDVNDILPKECNISKFITFLKKGSYLNTIKKLASSNNLIEIDNWCKDMNNITNSWKYFKKDDKLASLFYPYIPQDVLIAEISKDHKIFQQICKTPKKFKELLYNMSNSPTPIIKMLIEKKIYDDPNFLTNLNDDSHQSTVLYEKIVNTFTDDLRDMEKKLIASNATPHKIYVYNQFTHKCQQILGHRNLSKEEGKLCLSFLNHLAGKSHASSLSKKFSGFEIWLRKFIEFSQINQTDLEKNYPRLIKKLNQAKIRYNHYFLTNKAV